MLTQDDIDSVQQMGGTRTDGLQMMLTQFHHLLVVDGCDLGVPKSGHLSVEEGSGLDQVRASLGDVQALGLGIAALAAERDQATPTPEIAQGRKAQDIADEGDEDGCTVLPDALKRFQVALRMKLTVERTHGFETQLMDLGLCGADAFLLPL